MNIKIQTGLYGSEFYVDLVGNRNTLNSSNRDLVDLVEDFLATRPGSEWVDDLYAALKDSLRLVDEYLETQEDEVLEDEEELAEETL